MYASATKCLCVRLTLLVRMGFASEKEAHNAMWRVAQQAIDERVNRRKRRRDGRGRGGDRGGDAGA